MAQPQSLTQAIGPSPQHPPPLQVHVHMGQSTTDPPTLVAGGITMDAHSDTPRAHVNYSTYGCIPSTATADKTDGHPTQIQLDIHLSSVCLLHHLSLEISLADSTPGSPTAPQSPHLNSSGSADTVPATPVATRQEFSILAGAPALPRDLVAPAALSSSPPPPASGANENDDELSDSLPDLSPSPMTAIRPPSPTRSSSPLALPPTPTPTAAASTSPNVAPGGAGVAGRRRAGSMSGNRSPKASPPRLLLSSPSSPAPSTATLPSTTAPSPAFSPLSQAHQPPATPPDSSPTATNTHASPPRPPPTITLTGTLTATESNDLSPIHFHLDPPPAPPTPGLPSRRTLTYTVLGKADHVHLTLTATSTAPTAPPPTLTILSLHLSGYPLTTSPDARHLLNLLNLSTALCTLGNIPAAVECKTLAAIASLRAHKFRQYADLMRAASAAHVPLPDVPEGKQRSVFRAHVGATLAAMAGDGGEGDVARVAAGELEVAARMWVANEEKDHQEQRAEWGESHEDDDAPDALDLAWVLAHRLHALHQLACALLASGIEYHMHAGLDLVGVVLERAAHADTMHGRLQRWLMLATQAHHDLCVRVASGGVGGMSGGVADLMVRARQVLETVVEVLTRLEYRVVKKEVVEGWVVACAEVGGWSAEVFLHHVAYTLFAQHPTLVTSLPASYFESVLCSLFPDALG